MYYYILKSWFLKISYFLDIKIIESNYILLFTTIYTKYKREGSYFIDTKFSIWGQSYYWWIIKIIIVVSLRESLEILSTNNSLLPQKIMKKLVKNSCIHGVIGLEKKYWEKNCHILLLLTYTYITHILIQHSYVFYY